MIESLPNFFPAMAEIFILAMICIVLLVDLFVPQKNREYTYGLVQATLVIAFCMTAYLYTQPPTTTFYGMVIQDHLASLLKLLILISGFFSFLYARLYLKERDINAGEYYVLGLLSVLGMMTLVSANDLLVLYLSLEILSLPLYAMVALWRNNAESTEAAIKYYVVGSMASGFLLYGISFMYGVTGTLNLPDVAQVVLTSHAGTQLTLDLALVFVAAGFAFKLGAAPFHMWAPDVYEGAPTPVTLLITSAPKIAALGLTLRLLVDALPEMAVQWQQITIFIALLSMGIGNLAAIMQTNIKRMLAYSSIAHMGYMFLGIASATPQGFSASVFYMIIYAIMSMGAFAVVIMLTRAHFEGDQITDYRGLNSRSPWLAFAMLLLMFSMAGIPPTAGFFAKLGVLQALVNAHLVWLAAIALIFAVIGSYYYLAIVKVMYFEEPETIRPIEATASMRIAVTLNGFAILLLGLFPSGLITLCRQAF